MSHLIKDFMTQDVVTVGLNDSVFSAAEFMTRDSALAGYVIVLQQGQPIGIVTECDIIRKVIAQKRSQAKTKIASIMSTPLITIDPDAEFLTAPELMQKLASYLLPVKCIFPQLE
jgi:CBS domain-containing protein